MSLVWGTPKAFDGDGLSWSIWSRVDADQAGLPRTSLQTLPGTGELASVRYCARPSDPTARSTGDGFVALMARWPWSSGASARVLRRVHYRVHVIVIQRKPGSVRWCPSSFITVNRSQVNVQVCRNFSSSARPGLLIG